jgi:hypothetical protein
LPASNGLFLLRIFGVGKTQQHAIPRFSYFHSSAIRAMDRAGVIDFVGSLGCSLLEAGQYGLAVREGVWY